MSKIIIERNFSKTWKQSNKLSLKLCENIGIVFEFWIRTKIDNFQSVWQYNTLRYFPQQYFFPFNEEGKGRTPWQHYCNKEMVPTNPKGKMKKNEREQSKCTGTKRKEKKKNAHAFLLRNHISLLAPPPPPPPTLLLTHMTPHRLPKKKSLNNSI